MPRRRGSRGRASLPCPSPRATASGPRAARALVDAGLGDRVVEWQPEGQGPQKLEGGRLPRELAAAGIEPADIDVMLLTHLHLDHNGWVSAGDEPTFPNATVRFGAADWDAIVEGSASESGRMMRAGPGRSGQPDRWRR